MADDATLKYFIKQNKNLLITIIAVSLAIKLLFFFVFLQYNPCMLLFDSGHYHNAALQLAAGNGFSGADGAPYFYRLPGYPAFLAMCYAVCGNAPHIALLIQIIVSSCIPVLSALLALTLFPQARLLALLVAAMTAVHPGFVTMSGLMMSETLFVIFFLIYLVLFLPAVLYDRRQCGAMLLAGSALGIASLTRPVGLPLVLVSVVLLVIRYFYGARILPLRDGFSSLLRVSAHGEELRSSVSNHVTSSGRAPKEVSLKAREELSHFKIFFLFAHSTRLPKQLTSARGEEAVGRLEPYGRLKRQSIIFILGWLAIIGPWLVRNWLLTGVWFLHTLGGPHAINHGAARVYMQAHTISYLDAQRIIKDNLQVQYKDAAALQAKPLQEIERSTIAEKYVLSVCLQYPYQTIKLCINNMLKTVFGLYSSELLFIDSGGQLPPYDAQRGIGAVLKRFLLPTLTQPWLIIIMYADMLMHLFLLFGFIGYCVLACAGRKGLVPLGIALVYGTLFVGLSCICGFARLRLPIEPFLITLSLAFWIMLIQRIEES